MKNILTLFLCLLVIACTINACTNVPLSFETETKIIGLEGFYKVNDTSAIEFVKMKNQYSIKVYVYKGNQFVHIDSEDVKKVYFTDIIKNKKVNHFISIPNKQDSKSDFNNLQLFIESNGDLTLKLLNEKIYPNYNSLDAGVSFSSANEFKNQVFDKIGDEKFYDDDVTIYIRKVKSL